MTTFTPISSFHYCDVCGAVVYDLPSHEEWHKSGIEKELNRIIEGDDSDNGNIQQVRRGNISLGESFDWGKVDANEISWEEGDMLAYDTNKNLYMWINPFQDVPAGFNIKMVYTNKSWEYK